MRIHEINAIYYDTNHKQTIVLSRIEERLNLKPIEVIETLCNRYGLSGLGSINAIKHTLNIHQKCPILVHPILQIYFFPTVSMRDKKCIWINSKQIERLKVLNYETIIVFKDKTNVVSNVGVRSLRKQISRCEMMEDKIIKQYQIDQLSLKL